MILCSSLSFAETTDDEKNVDYWNSEQFSEVIFPSEFGIGENLIWGSKLLFNHPDLNEIVPGYAYRYDSYAHLCELGDSELEDTIQSLPEARIIHVGKNTTKTNEWKKIIEPACSDSITKINLDGWVATESDAEVKKIMEIVLRIYSNSEHTLHQDGDLSDEFLILTNDEVPDIDPAVAFWWRCDSKQKQIPDTVCHEVFTYSPFTKHKQLVETVAEK